MQENYCRLIIKKRNDVLNIINLIKGKMRTPKIEALHYIINWINLNKNIKLLSLLLDNSSILSNSWLLVFIEGRFNWLYDKKKITLAILYEIITT